MVYCGSEGNVLEAHKEPTTLLLAALWVHKAHGPMSTHVQLTTVFGNTTLSCIAVYLIRTCYLGTVGRDLLKLCVFVAAGKV